MSDPVEHDVMDLGEFGVTFGVPEDRVPELVANELRRIYESHGDPSLYFLIVRAQEIETL